MSDLNQVMDAILEKRGKPDEKELGELVRELFLEADRLFTALKRPENREILRFAIAWSNLRENLQALKQVVDERLREIREKQADPLSELFEQLIVKE